MIERNQRSGLFFILVAITSYSFLPVFVKNIQPTGLPALDALIWRYLIATPVIWLVVLARRGAAPAERLPRLKLLGLGIILAVGGVAAFYGLELIPASTYIVLFYTYPAMVALISIFLGERLPWQGWLALGLTLVGTVLIAGDFTAGLGRDNLIGAGLSLFNAVVVAVYFILSNRFLRGHTDLARASAWAITGVLLSLTPVVLLQRLALPQGQVAWGNLLALGTFSTVLPIFALITGIQKLGASRSAIMSTLEPVTTSLLAMLLLGERMAPLQLAGGVFIIASVIMLQLTRASTTPPQDKAVPTLQSSDLGYGETNS